MEAITLFVHHQGAKELVELDIAQEATCGALLDHADMRVLVEKMRGDGPVVLFIDENTQALEMGAKLNEVGARNGSRLHVGRHHSVEVEVFYQNRTAARRFPPGTKVRRVKDWVAHEFGLASNDAAEHVLQLHGTVDQPDASTPLSVLMSHSHCKVEFDFVPAKRVEG